MERSGGIACVSLEPSRWVAHPKGRAISYAQVPLSLPAEAALRYYGTGRPGNRLKATQSPPAEQSSKTQTRQEGPRVRATGNLSDRSDEAWSPRPRHK